ncbi:zinc-binding alcohol dehydrogenase family protein [Ralstonia pickettii]|uniref:Zinc-binding alcohol dehydrogenase family protein n=1 Tax=Ralstonia pickettii TaxID=329 RepID=A0A7X2HK34_RALPI|nr:zinc-dependent alcohol dehydrogenase family protein [Ralstonia pickettii]MRS97976.1 zinc-binding alcohol dehydrogenase family protein [Ralstonia pickettii]
MSESMRAMVMQDAGKPLIWRAVPMPVPGPGEVRIAVSVCGVCRTDLHIVDGELTAPKPFLIPGHEIVGIVESCGAGVTTPAPGERVGVPWLGWTCGVCTYCLHGRENLCDHPAFTGYTRDGGYAQYVVCDARFCLPIPARYDDAHAAPLLCAGLIGFRTLRMAGDARRIGIYGFGAAAHLITQIAVAEQRDVFAFTRAGDTAAQQLALDTGARWAGASDTAAPEPLDAALIFAPIGALVPQALQAVVKGGTVVCGGIHMSDIPAFPYRWLWEERKLVSVANLTRADGLALMRVAADIPLRVRVTPYRLQDANTALADLRAGRVAGAAVLQVASKDL